MTDPKLYEDEQFYYLRSGDEDPDIEGESEIVFDEELSLLVGLPPEDSEERIRVLGANLAKTAYTEDEAQHFFDDYDFSFFSREEEDIIVPPIYGCAELTDDLSMDGYLLMTLKEAPPLGSIRDQLEEIDTMMEEEELFMEMDDDFPFELPFRDPDHLPYELPDNRDRPLLDLFLASIGQAPEPARILKGLEELDPYVMEDMDDPHLERYMPEYGEFYGFFMDQFSDDEELLEYMQEHSPEPPLILQVSGYLYEKQFVENTVAQIPDLPEQQRDALEKIVEYVRDRDVYREITILMEDDMFYDVEIDEGTQGEELMERLDFLRAYLVEFCRGNGVMYIQFNDKDLQKGIINGFSSINQTIRKMPVADLKKTLDLEQKWEDQVVLQIAFIDI